MPQGKTMLKRLLKPKVFISIASEVISILVLFNINIDMNIVTAIITSAFSILIFLGIISDPNTQKKGYGDDIFKCTTCNKTTEHVLVNGQMTCRGCGGIHNNSPIKKPRTKKIFNLTKIPKSKKLPK